MVDVFFIRNSWFQAKNIEEGGSLLRKNFFLVNPAIICRKGAKNIFVFWWILFYIEVAGIQNKGKGTLLKIVSFN